jgi:hypothetical protein
MASATPVTDHDEIREWVESRGGHPACVKGTAALLRVDFDPPDAKLQQISWDDWFDTFESRRLAAMIQEGGRSRFIKLVSRAGANARRRGAGGGSARGRKTAGGRGSSGTGARGAERTNKSTGSPRSTSGRGGAARKTGTRKAASKRGSSTGRTAAKRAAGSSTRTSSTGARSSGKRAATSSRGKKAVGGRGRGAAKKR